MIEKGLSKEEMDFVTEALSIGAGNTATALSQMFGCSVDLSFPKVYFLSPEEAPSIIEDRSLRTIVAKIGFVGDITGDIFYVVKEGDVRELVNLIEKTFPVDEKAGIAEIPVMEETANIITGVYLSAIGNFCGLNVNQTIPVVSSTTIQALTDEFKAKGYQLKGMELVAIVNEITVADRRIETYLLLALSREALKIFSMKIAEALRKLEIKGLEEKVAHRTLELQTVVETAGEGIIGIKPPGEIYLWNRKAEEMFGYPAEEAIGKEIHTLITPERYREKAGDGYRTFLQTGTGPIVGKSIEIEALRKDGAEFPVELSISAMNIRGEWHSTGIVRDITERKKAAEALHNSEEAFRTLFESSRDAIMTLTANEGFLSGNSATVSLFGCRDEQEFIALSPALTSPEFQPDGRRSDEKAQEMIRLAMDKGSHFFEWVHKRVDGTEFFADVLLTCMEIGDKKLLQATVRDITERKKAENELKDRLGELERFHRVTVDREIRMHEVMEENEGLKKKVEEMKKR